MCFRNTQPNDPDGWVEVRVGHKVPDDDVIAKAIQWKLPRGWEVRETHNGFLEITPKGGEGFFSPRITSAMAEWRLNRQKPLVFWFNSEALTKRKEA